MDNKGKKKKDNKLRNTYEGDDEGNDKAKLNKALLLLAKESLEFQEVLILTHNDDETIRLKALQRLCPCRVKDEIEQFWNRIFEMVNDESPKVRYQVLHNICDGAPPELEPRVAEALEVFNRDPDKDIKRTAHKVLASYLRTGKWNIL
jgi:DNA-binding Xre family transcriptional regulator